MIVLLLVACARAPLPVDHLQQVLGALDLAQTIASAQHPSDPAACVGWEVVAAAAPVASAAIGQAHLGAPVALPALDLRLSSCLGDPPDIAPVVERVDLGLAAVTMLVPTLAVEDCRARVTAEAAIQWARSVEIDGWDVHLPAVAVDLGGCAP